VSPWVFLAGVLAIVSAFGSGYLAGGRHERQAAEARERAAVVAAVEEGNRIAAQDLARAVAAEKARSAARGAQVERRTQVEERIRTEMVYLDRDCSIDPVSLRVLNSAIGGNATPDPPASGSGDGGMPAAGPSRRPDDGGAAEKGS
jgi:hypothetical protein